VRKQYGGRLGDEFGLLAVDNKASPLPLALIGKSGKKKRGWLAPFRATVIKTRDVKISRKK